MDFYEVLDQVIDLLRSRGRVTYRALKRQFRLDDDFLDDLKDEIIKAQQQAVDENGEVLVWTGATEAPHGSPLQPNQPSNQPPAQQAQPPQVESLPTETSLLEAERRQLTILFADLVDSTKLSSEIDAEEYREIVRAYQAACAEVIERFECHLAQILGDGLLVYSGYPVAHENDAERAVRVGLGLLDAMQTLNERLEQETGTRLSIRVGIHTGLVVVGDVGAGLRPEQLALGEVPNVAARIQGLAAPDTVIISDATSRLVQGYFAWEALGEHDVRGVAEPLVVYRVLQESGAQSRLDVVSARGLTPLVGREQEVGLLLERWAHATEGHGQGILLRGEAGIGKSRLVQALKDHVADEPHTRLECRSSPYHQHTALYPITDLLQRTVRFQADDTPEQRLKKLEQTLSQYRLPLEETVPLCAPLLSLSIPEDRYPPFNWTPQRQRQKTLEAIVSILLELAEREPVLFILEDLHWTDPSTLELLDLLIDQMPTASIVMLLSCRPAFQPSWSHRSYVTDVTVDRLSRNHIARMAEQVAGGKSLPPEVLQQIVDRTDGVPLFVEELTRAILESGHLQAVDGHYELTGAFSALAIPATLQDSLMARLDRLVTAKAVAQYAAVIGRQFSYALLQAVSPLDAMTLQRELGRLVQAELVYQRGLPPQATYTFKHALIQDAAYQSLLKSMRQQYHQRIAQALEAQFPETVAQQPELLAHHYTEAGLTEQAIVFWQRAGERAIQRSANAEAISHLTSGLALLHALPDTPERMQHELSLQISRGVALITTKGFSAPEVRQTYNRALELCNQIGETPELCSVLAGLWTFYFTHAEFQTAWELGEQLLSLAQRTSDQASFLPGAHNALGIICFIRGELLSACTHIEQGVALSQLAQHDVTSMRAMGVDAGPQALGYYGWALAYRGYPDQARMRDTEALALAQELSHPYTLARTLNYSAYIYQCCREWSMVQTQAEAVITLATEQGFTLVSALGSIMHGWALAMQGQGREGIVQLRQGLTVWESIGTEATRPLYLALLAEAYGTVGQPVEGLAVLAEALTLVDKTGERFYAAELFRLKAELLLQRSSDHQPETETCFQTALEVARNQQAKALELRAATSLARLWQSQGKCQDAHDLLAPIYEWFTEGFDTADLQEAKALLDELG